MHQKILVGAVAALLLTFGGVALAAGTYTIKSGDTLGKIAVANHLSLAQLISFNPLIKNINLIYPGQVVKLSVATNTKTTTSKANTTTTTKTVVKTTTAPKAPTTSASTPAPIAGEVRFTAYTTGYGWPDNTPKGSAEISHGILRSLAGGTGSYTNPITLAVGHSFATGKDVLDYPAGTKFYIPSMRKYFIAEDTCGDGSSPQNGPCHSGYQGKVWLDLWVGGNSSNESATLDCEDTITDTHLVIKNPAANYAVVTGDVASGCKVYSDIVVTQ